MSRAKKIFLGYVFLAMGFVVQWVGTMILGWGLAPQSWTWILVGTVWSAGCFGYAAIILKME